MSWQIKARDRKTVRDQVVEYVAAFANAEGGVLILGIEDDHTVTGHAYKRDTSETLLKVPQARLEPPQPAGFVVKHSGKELVVFDVPASDVPVKVTGDGFPLRMGDKTTQSSETQIQALKFHGMAASWESKPSTLSIADLDQDLLTSARAGAGRSAVSNEEYLLSRKLADRRGKQIVLRNAAELLFAKYPEHPNAGIRLFRVVGTERRLGAEHNVEERPRIEGPLPHVLDETFRIIESLLRRPARLIGSKFQTAPEYPDFAWREAILNAIAHRDYMTEGRCVEVWLYDDRMEVISPGKLRPAISLESLRNMERLHASRNPRLVRGLVDLGFMRDQGEGIPRMFYEMQDSFLPNPELGEQNHTFSVTLRNTATLTDQDKDFVSSIAMDEFSREEFRALLEAHRTGKIDNGRMRELTGLDTLQASRLLGRLRDRYYLVLHPAGAGSYYTLPQDLVPDKPDLLGKPKKLGAKKTGELKSKRDELGGKRDELGAKKTGELVSKRDELSVKKTGELDKKTGELDKKTGELDKKTGELDKKTGELDKKTGELDKKTGELDKKTGEVMRDELLSRLPTHVRAQIESSNSRPRRDAYRELLVTVASHGEWTPRELATLFRRRNVRKLVDEHLTPLVVDGNLERTMPEQPTHPNQAYRAAIKEEDE